MRAILLAAATASLVCAATPPAFAHAHLLAADPAEKSTVTASPAAITLRFSEEIELKFSKATVSGPGNAAVKTGEATHGKGGNDILEIPVVDTLSPGAYSIDWQVLSKDGHKVKGHSTFTVKR